MSLLLAIAATTLTSQWQYLPPTAALPGGAAVRKAARGEPTLITCTREGGRLLIAAGPSEARTVRLRSGYRDSERSLERADSGSTLLNLRSTDLLLEGLASQARPLSITYGDGRATTIEAVPPVARIVRECRSTAYRSYLFKDAAPLHVPARL